MRRLAPTSPPRARRGLAPLELVLGLPIMLFVMALIINVGAAGAWKVRHQANARNASWRTFDLRSGDSNPNPPLWPYNAPVNAAGGADVAQVAQIWNADPDLIFPGVRGPALGSLNIASMLEIGDDVHDGRAELERRVPLLQTVLPNDGRYRFDVAQNVLDGMWQFHHIHDPGGRSYVDNNDRRGRLLFPDLGSDLEPNPDPVSPTPPQGLYSQFFAMQPFYGLLTYSLRTSLAPLDADPDLYRLSGLPPQYMGGPLPPPDLVRMPSSDPRRAPDFYPWFRACLDDPMTIASSNEFDSFLSQVRRLPGTMGRYFLARYQARLQYLQMLQMQDPPGQVDPAEMQQLEEDIDKLNQFLSALPMQHR